MLNGKAAQNTKLSNHPLRDSIAIENGLVKLSGQLEKLLIKDSAPSTSVLERFRSCLLKATQPVQKVVPRIENMDACIQAVRLAIDHHESLDFKTMGQPNMMRLIVTVIESKHPIIESLRKDFFDVLYQQKYFKNENVIEEAFKAALESQTPKAFRDLLEHINIIPNHLLNKYANLIVAKVAHLDLFHRLNPDDYEKKYWRELNSYEKLYFIVFEYYFSKKLAHRIGLIGKFSIQWGQENLRSLGVQIDKADIWESLEGEHDGRTFTQIKEALLLFQLTYKGSHKKVLIEAIEELCAFPISMNFEFKHKLRDGKNHIYIYNLDGHMTTGYHTTSGRYYEINMGFLSGNFAGISIYHVNQEQRPQLHQRLTGLQYNHKTKHFHKVPIDCNLKRFGYIKLPGQPSGNCTYESIKGLFLALLFDKFCQTLTNRKAAMAALTIYRQFCEYDGKDAIFDYRQHSLKVNQALLTQAYQVKPTFLEQQVYDHEQFVFHNLKKEYGQDNTVHRHTKNRVRTICFK